MKPELIAGEGRDRHFLSSSNPPDVSGRCFAHFISCKPHKWSVRKVVFLFLGDGSRRSEKIVKATGLRPTLRGSAIPSPHRPSTLSPASLVDPCGAQTHSSHSPCSHSLGGGIN